MLDATRVKMAKANKREKESEDGVAKTAGGRRRVDLKMNYGLHALGNSRELFCPAIKGPKV